MMGVSRNHAVIMAKDNSLVIQDNGSANGTRLNGYSLTRNQPYRLRHGDELTFGQLTVQVLFAVVPLVKAQRPEDTVIPAIGKGQNVLIVEDDTDVASVFGMILEQAGFHVTVVHSGVAALSSMDKETPNAVVLDLMLPDMDGLDLATYIRKKETNGTHIPVVVVSGATGGFQMHKALEAGVDLFLGKPVGVDEPLRWPKSCNSEFVSAYTALQTPRPFSECGVLCVLRNCRIRSTFYASFQTTLELQCRSSTASTYLYMDCCSFSFLWGLC
jgi:CheY-like chemotaxis protein